MYGGLGFFSILGENQGIMKMCVECFQTDKTAAL